MSSSAAITFSHVHSQQLDRANDQAAIINTRSK